jgi:Xaa-Pro dipeptidase
MALHFTHDEFARRQKAALTEMARQGLDGLLLFRQESMYYLTGYDTEGFVLFQGMYLSSDGRVALCTRSADKLQSRLTSTLEDVRIWRDVEGANPAIDLRNMVEDLGGHGKRVGVEYHAYGLTGQRAKLVDAAFDGWAKLSDASDLVRLLRLVKSPAELKYVRKAGKLADAALAVANRMTKPGIGIGAIYGKMIDVIMAGDGDPSAARWPMGGGEDAMMVRYHTGHGRVKRTDQVMFEFASSYRHYHTALMNVVLTGKVDPRHRSMFSAAREALDACMDTLRPGRTVGEVYDTHARVLTKAGLGDAILNACGYTMGATYPPNWMDWPMCWHGNPQVLAPGMVFFLHMILLDGKTGLSMSVGETAIVTEGKCEKVTHAPRALVANAPIASGRGKKVAVKKRRAKR